MYDSILRSAAGGRRALVPAISLFALSSAGLLAGGAANAQDPVKVDAKHYKVEFENDSVRVLRITYPAHEKSVMHHHRLFVCWVRYAQHAHTVILELHLIVLGVDLDRILRIRCPASQQSGAAEGKQAD